MTLENIRENLSDRNLAEVARRIGVTRAWLSAIKNGASCSDQMRFKIVKYLVAK
jgi:plasmid maintenance system antidote protein VapI